MTSRRILCITQKDGTVTRIREGKKFRGNDFSVTWKKVRGENGTTRHYVIHANEGVEFENICYETERETLFFCLAKYGIVVCAIVAFCAAVATVAAWIAAFVSGLVCVDCDD